MAVQVSFYTDAADPLVYACRLIRRALTAGKPVGVRAQGSDAVRLDELLWSFDAAEFIPHRRWDGTTPAAFGEVLLVDDASRLPHRGLLLNVGDDMPDDALRFERVLEVIGRDPSAVQAGRARYRAYQEAGARLDHFSAAS
ncbi:MAG: DNA polymerase III subunit chi [Rubrivivax sp.]|nr:MAG: DNA polymerase III subunit chi [Rubrivivax sp.]